MMLESLLRWIDKVTQRVTVSAPQKVDGDKLIHRIDLTVDASCPCGSSLIHHLTLMTTVDCPRCGRTIAIRSIAYHRTSPASIPNPVISIGWVHSDEHLRTAQTRGVH